jgi:hypothetical protein
MNNIVISAPAGSGMTYATLLLKLAYNNKAEGCGHERFEIEDSGPQIVILRNPYDAVASGAERWVKGSGHSNFEIQGQAIDATDLEGMKNNIINEEARYLTFFKDIEYLRHIKILSFELLTQNTKKFIQEAGSHFGYTYDSDEELEAKTFNELKIHGYENRAPREKFPARQTIEDLISEKYDKQNWECWRIYSELKAKLDEKGL